MRLRNSSTSGCESLEGAAAGELFRAARSHPMSPPSTTPIPKPTRTLSMTKECGGKERKAISFVASAIPEDAALRTCCSMPAGQIVGQPSRLPSVPAGVPPAGGQSDAATTAETAVGPVAGGTPAPLLLQRRSHYYFNADSTILRKSPSANFTMAAGPVILTKTLPSSLSMMAPRRA